MTQTQVDLIVGAVWLVCVIVCFLKWKIWTAIFGISAPILSDIPIGGMYLHHIITEPFIYVGLPAAAIRLAKPVSWWAKWFYYGPLGSDRRLLRPSPKLARALARFPEQTVDFEKPRPKSSNSATQKTDTKQNCAVKPGDFCRFQPNMKSVGRWRLEKGMIDLAPGDIVKVVGAAGEELKDEMCYVNKPGKCPVLVTMELVDTEWLELVNGKFNECEYCGAIEHETSDCPYRGKVPYGRKGDFSWRIEDGKTIFE